MPEAYNRLLKNSLGCHCDPALAGEAILFIIKSKKVIASTRGGGLKKPWTAQRGLKWMPPDWWPGPRRRNPGKVRLFGPPPEPGVYQNEIRSPRRLRSPHVINDRLDQAGAFAVGRAADSYFMSSGLFPAIFRAEPF
jgi:hypothetical protein